MTNCVSGFVAASRRARLALGVAGTLLLGASGLRASDAPALGLHAGRDDTLTQYEAFGDWLGRKVMYRVVFCDMSNWAGIASPWFIGTTRRWLESDPRRVEVITVPLLTKGQDGDFNAVISGAHDADFRSLAQKIETRGLSSRVIIRLGWEGNGDWYPWAYAANPAGYRAAFRRVVGVMRAAAPALRFEWCVTCRASRRGGPASWTEGYPGDDVVDIVSMDTYDEFQTRWESFLDGEAGLREFREFAIARGKPEAYPEWSCSTNTSARGGGDNVSFIKNMSEWFQARPGGVLYQAYWNVSSDGPRGAIYGVASILVPNAAAKYHELFGNLEGASDPSVE